MRKESRMKRWDKWLRTKFDTAIARVPALGLKNREGVAVVILTAIIFFGCMQIWSTLQSNVN